MVPPCLALPCIALSGFSMLLMCHNFHYKPISISQCACIWSTVTSSVGNIFRVTGPLCGEFTGHRVNFPHKGQWRGALVFYLICAWINGWVNNREAGNLRRHRAHYDVTVSPFCSLTVITAFSMFELLLSWWVLKETSSVFSLSSLSSQYSSRSCCDEF